jgi:hypothetical protein
VEWARTPPRAAGCSGLGFFVLHLSQRANARPSLDQDVFAPDSRVRVLVIRAPENWSIAKKCWRPARLHDYSSWQRTDGYKRRMGEIIILASLALILNGNLVAHQISLTTGASRRPADRSCGRIGGGNDRCCTSTRYRPCAGPARDQESAPSRSALH